MIERIIEKLIYASRWILAPVYLGMSLAVLALGIKFFEVIFHLLPHILEVSEIDLVLTLLTLVDLVLVGSLLIMVMFSGYENYVSRLDIPEGTEKLDWLGKLDSGSLKLKVAASIVAITSIHLLKVFMNVENTPNDKILWYVIIHLTLVISAILLGILDYIAKKQTQSD